MGRKRFRLADARKDAGFTQEELAARLGVDRSTIGRWETGDTEPHAWIRPKLARVLHVSLAQLAGMIGDRSDRTLGLPGSEPARQDDRVVGCSERSTLDEIVEWMAGIVDSATSDSAIERLSRATVALAESDTLKPRRHGYWPRCSVCTNKHVDSWGANNGSARCASCIGSTVLSLHMLVCYSAMWDEMTSPNVSVRRLYSARTKPRSIRQLRGPRWPIGLRWENRFVRVSTSREWDSSTARRHLSDPARMPGGECCRAHGRFQACP